MDQEPGQLTQHKNGKKRKLAASECAADLKAAKALPDQRNRALAALSMPLTILIRLIYWLCLESIAMVKLSSLYLMVTALHVLKDAFGPAVPTNYVNAARCREFVMALDSVIKSKLWVDNLNSPYVSVCIDESTDISTSGNLIVYIVYLDRNVVRKPLAQG